MRHSASPSPLLTKTLGLIDKDKIRLFSPSKGGEDLGNLNLNGEEDGADGEGADGEKNSDGGEGDENY